MNGDRLATQFKVLLDEETAGFVIMHDQQPSWELENNYAPWSSKAKWEFVHWLGTSQLSQSDINKSLKWVSHVSYL